MTLLADVPRRHELRHALRRLARVGSRLLLREVHRRRRDAAHAARGVPAAEDQRGDARLLGAHEEVGQGGHFLGAAHTLERFRECFYRPLLSSTENYERWIAERRQGRGRARNRHLAQDARRVRGAGDGPRAEGRAEGVCRPPRPSSATRWPRCSSRGAWDAAATGETFTAESPGHGRAIGEVPQGARGRRARAIDAANGAADGWARLTAFERAALHAPGRRRDREAPRRARAVLTLDQGKPLHESRDEVEELVAYWRNAAEDGKRLEGRLAELVHAGQARAARAPPARRDRCHHALELAVHDAGGADRACARVGQHGRLDARVDDCRLRDAPRGVRCRGRPAAGVFNLVTGPGSVVGDEIARNPGTHGVGFIGSTETGRKVAEAAAGKAAVLELGGNGPVVVMDDADLELAAEAAVTACFLCAGQSCTAGERLLVHRDVRERVRLAAARQGAAAWCSATPSPTGRRWARSTTTGVAEKMDEHVADALERGAQLVHGGERAAGFPTSLYWQATVLDGVPADVARRHRGDVRTGCARRRDRLARRGDRAGERVAYGLLSAIFTRDLAQGLRYADEVKTGWVNINDSSNYWEAHLPFGGRVGNCERHRARRRRGADGVVHRAADRRRRVTLRLRDRRRRDRGMRARQPAERRTRRRSVLVLEAGRPGLLVGPLHPHAGGALVPDREPLLRLEVRVRAGAGMHGRRIYHARGKVLGGSSSINGMIFQRGNPLDYERWAPRPGSRRGTTRTACRTSSGWRRASPGADE